eukprot:g33039.t1
MPETHLRLGKILRQLVTATTVKEYFRFAYSYHSQATQEVEISCASELYFFAWVPFGLAEALESKYANPEGEIKCDWDETFPKTADKLSVKVTKYIQRSHQQAALPSPTLTSSSSSSPAIGLGPSVVGTLASSASPPNLQQSLADKARYTTEIADLKAQLEAAKVDFQRRLDEANQQHASAVDFEKAAKVDFKRRLEEANQQHANAMIFQKQRENGLVTELKGARTSFDKEVAKYKSELVSVRQVLETDQNEMAALKDELVAATDEVKSLKKTIAYKDRALRESKKKITKKQEHSGEERDELLAEVESEKVQASHHKERADKLAKSSPTPSGESKGWSSDLHQLTMAVVVVLVLSCPLAEMYSGPLHQTRRTAVMLLCVGIVQGARLAMLELQRRDVWSPHRCSLLMALGSMSWCLWELIRVLGLVILQNVATAPPGSSVTVYV